MKLLSLLSLHRECKASYQIVYRWYEESRDEAAILRNRVYELEQNNEIVSRERDKLALDVRALDIAHSTYVERTNRDITKLENQLRELDLEKVLTPAPAKRTRAKRVNKSIDTEGAA